MKVIKPRRLAVLHRPFEKHGRYYLSVKVGILCPFDQPERILPEVALWKIVAAELGKDAALDDGMPKQRGEVLLKAKCFSGGAPRRAMEVRLRIGSIDKTLWVFGNRLWRTGASGPRIGDPEPFDEIDISWNNAFGGPGFAMNPIGKGIAPIQSPAGRPVVPLPNIEDPRALIATPNDRPAPAGFAPYDLTWQQRASKAGSYSGNYLRKRFPYHAADMDWSIFNAAPADQQIDGFLAGGVEFECFGLHPRKPVVRGRIPRLAARCFITRAGDKNESFSELSSVTETLWLFPHRERAIVLFCATGEIFTDDAFDVLNLVVGVEEADRPKGADHYRAVMKTRLDRSRGFLSLLRDGDLMPAPVPAASPLAEEENDMEQLAAVRNVALKRVRARAEKELAEAKAEAKKSRESIVAECKARGAPVPDLSSYDKILSEQLPPLKEIGLEELLDTDLDRIEREIKSMADDALAKQREAEARLRDQCRAQGIDYDSLAEAERRKAAGPPRFFADERLTEMHKVREELARQGLVNEKLEKMLADPELKAKLRNVEADLKEGYRHFAHYFPDSPRMEPERAARVRTEIVERHRRGEDFYASDLTGADLSGLTLKNANLSHAFIADANLDGADLSGADLTGAVLARTSLSRARLTGAQLNDVNLGRADLSGADLSGSSLRGAILVEAVLEGASLRGANLSGADLMGAKLARADFSGAVASELRLLEPDLSGTCFEGANLTSALFYKARMTEMNLKGANLERATMVGVDGRKLDAAGAKLAGFIAAMDCNLEGANFSGASLQEANLRSANLEGANFEASNLDLADLSMCNLRRANLRKVSAKGARFVRAALEAAEIGDADLFEAVLQKAALDGANLQRSNLFRADFILARIDSKTVFAGANLKRTLLFEAPRS
jgi:uncharacterized protein YjbI with pentapeptide repeats